MSEIDVVGLGYAGMDHLCIVPEFPRSGHKYPVESYLRQGGGQTGTAMTALARWGLRVAAVCAVGDDQAGRDIVDELRREGVDTSHVVRRAGVISQTAFILVEQDGGERTIVYCRQPALNLVPGDADLSLLERARCLFIDGHEELAVEAARRARELGLTVVLDSERLRPFTGELLGQCDVVLCNREFPGEFTGETDPEAQLRRLAEHGMAIVGMTLGKDGAMALCDGELVHRPAFVTDVVDTTGAGDVFHAGFTYAHLEGHPVEVCLDFASAAAALKCRAVGGRTGIPHGADEVWQLVRTGERRRGSSP